MLRKQLDVIGARILATSIDMHYQPHRWLSSYEGLSKSAGYERRIEPRR